MVVCDVQDLFDSKCCHMPERVAAHDKRTSACMCVHAVWSHSKDLKFRDP